MACYGSQAPINLTSAVNNNDNLPKCYNTCKFSFKYGISDCRVKVNRDFLSYKYDNRESDVTFNSETNYNVKDVRIYCPPLTYYDENAVAEIFIHHENNSRKPLVICIPVIKNDNTTNSSTLLEQIITKITDNDDEQSINTSYFTLNSLIPISEYYYYEGKSIPYSRGGSCRNIRSDIIVFPVKTNNSINMNDYTYEALQDLIDGKVPIKSKLQTKDDVTIYHNNNGTQYNTFDTGDDNIYIECKPVGDDGNVIEGSNNDMNENDFQTKEELWKSILSWGLLGLLIIVLLISVVLMRIALNKVANGKNILTIGSN